MAAWKRWFRNGDPLGSAHTVPGCRGQSGESGSVSRVEPRTGTIGHRGVATDSSPRSGACRRVLHHDGFQPGPVHPPAGYDIVSWSAWQAGVAVGFVHCFGGYRGLSACVDKGGVSVGHKSIPEIQRLDGPPGRLGNRHLPEDRPGRWESEPRPGSWSGTPRAPERGDWVLN